jgi:hypothetical protein
MVIDPTGHISSVIELRDAAAKNGSGRLIPVHPDLCQAPAADAPRAFHRLCWFAIGSRTK